MTKPTTDECIAWLDEYMPMVNDRRNIVLHFVTIRAQIIAAQEMAKAIQECLDEAVTINKKRPAPQKFGAPYGGLVKINKALTSWRESGGE